MDILKKDVCDFADIFNLHESFRDKSILVTGVTGLIGTVFAKCLLELDKRYKLNLNIIAPVRNVEKARRLFVEDCNLIELIEIKDIRDFDIETDVDYFVHLANPTASKYFSECPVETLEITIEGTSRMLYLAKKLHVKSFVFVSSLEVYGTNLNDQLLTEDFQGYVNPLESRSSYNMGKRAAECLCHAFSTEYGLPVKIARLTQTFGAGVEYNDGRVFAQFARCVIEDADIVLQTKGETSRMYCYTTDAVIAILFILLKGKCGEAYNVANKDTYISIFDMAQMLREHFNDSIKVVLGKGFNNSYAPQTKLKLDTCKIEALGWKPQVGLVQMYDRLIKYMESTRKGFN